MPLRTILGPGRWDDPKHSVTVGELVRRGSERPQRAFITSFVPVSLSYISEHFREIETTLVMQSDDCSCECDGCGTELRCIGGGSSHCAQCDYDSCSKCNARNCASGHMLQPKIPIIFSENKRFTLVDLCRERKWGVVHCARSI